MVLAASGEAPTNLPRPKMQSGKPTVGPRAPPRPQRATESQNGALEGAQGGSLGRAMGSHFSLKKQCFLHIFMLWEATDFATIFNENMQKALFFQCKTALDALPGDPPGRAINSACGSQMLLFDMNQAHPTNRKTR